MILSNRHRFIFIKGVKVGGTSVEIALSPLCAPDDIVTPITAIDELERLGAGGGARNYSSDPAAEHAYLERLRQASVADLISIETPALVYSNHMSLRDVVRLYGSAALDYRIVCVERHPYAKIISWANHQLSYSAYQTGGEMRSDWRELKDYLHQAVEDRRIVTVKNIERYRGLDGLISARVMRFEQLTADFRGFIQSLGIDYRAAFPHAKRGILANELDPRDLLDKRQINLINEIFQEEFDTFNYKPL